MTRRKTLDTIHVIENQIRNDSDGIIRELEKIIDQSRKRKHVIDEALFYINTFEINPAMVERITADLEEDVSSIKRVLEVAQPVSGVPMSGIVFFADTMLSDRVKAKHNVGKLLTRLTSAREGVLKRLRENNNTENYEKVMADFNKFAAQDIANVLKFAEEEYKRRQGVVSTATNDLKTANTNIKKKVDEIKGIIKGGLDPTNITRASEILADIKMHAAQQKTNLGTIKARLKASTQW